jgi:serine O-acetyltransferase
MISSKADLKQFLDSDRVSLGRVSSGGFAKRLVLYWLCGDPVWEFQVALRNLEYLHNQPKGLWRNLRKAWCYHSFRRLSERLGFSIPVNVFGPGLSIAHRGTIVVNTGARVGANCRLHVCVNIGTEAGKSHAAPKIGNNVYIGPGAKIYGEIEIADDCAIGANAVVNKSFLEPGSLIAGVPARKIGQVDTSKLLIKGCQNSHVRIETKSDLSHRG